MLGGIELNTIYNEDCLETMKRMPDKSIDLVITDPPYGIKIAKSGKVGGGSHRGKTQTFQKIDWDNEIPTKAVFDEILRVSRNQIIWGGNYFLDYLPSTRCMLTWYKRDGLPIRTFADCELAWTSFDMNSMVFNCRWDGFIRDSREPKVAHPTQKALEVMKWCVRDFSTDTDVIYDPFLGSGTTALACQELGRNYIGSEISKEYCEIAEKRLGQQVLL